MPELNLMDQYPVSKRSTGDRAAFTEEHRRLAKLFDKDYFDGDRMTGYGGYNYHPRFWQGTVKRLRDFYNLKPDASVLDIGCAKGFMMHDFKELMPEMTIRGVDVSQYAIDNALPDMKPYIQVADAQSLPFPDKSFDLVLAINTIHNLPLEACKKSLREIMRVSRGHAFIMVDAWRNEDQHQKMLKWVLTAQTMMHVDEWVELFKETGYTGEYWWFTVE